MSRPLNAAERGLDGVAKWSALALALFGIKVWGDAFGYAGWRGGVFFAALALHAINLWHCRSLLRQGRFEPALARILWGSLIFFTVGAIYPDDNPSTSVLPVVFVAIGLPYLSERKFIRYSLLCLASLVLNLLLVVLWPFAARESPIEHAIGNIYATSASVAVCLMLFWQIKNSMDQGDESRKKAREEAGLEEERYRMVVENAREGICVWDLDGRTVVQNELMAELLGGAAGFKENVLERSLHGEVVSREIQVSRADGKRWLLLNGNPLRDSQGAISGGLAVATDITELKQLQGRLEQALGVEAEGRLAGGIAHDMNNVLAVVRGSCDLMQQQLQEADASPAALQALQRIRASAQSASALIQQLLTGQAPLAPAAPKALPAAADPGAPKRLLLVDDDDDVRSMAARALRNEGFDVVEASGADGARKLMASLGDSVNMLVTDVMMPGTPGPELAAELKRRYPYLKVLFISGYTGEMLGGQERFWPSHSFLAKPFSAKELSSKIRQALES